MSEQEQQPAVPEVDWTAHDQYPENELHCRCGQIYNSHSKFVASVGTVVSRKPCPGCNQLVGHVRAARDMQSYRQTIRRK